MYLIHMYVYKIHMYVPTVYICVFEANIYVCTDIHSYVVVYYIKNTCVHE
jgi:hypothetical protein